VTVATERITVCVCTYKRPALLESLLEALNQQDQDPRFSFDVVVVDNDDRRTSEAVVQEFSGRQSLKVLYCCEPNRSISLARNMAVRNAGGNLLAFIDDDERPVRDWLVQLFRTLERFHPDGVLGPVLPDYPDNAPNWLKKGRVLERRRHETGSRIALDDARTGNVLLRRALFDENEVWFDPAFGRTGGEDSDFFERQFAKGKVFIWCDQAVAYETVPPERWKGSFHMKRMWRAGTSTGEWMRAGRLPAGAFLAKYSALFATCVAVMPLALVAPKHLRMTALQKMSYSGGVLAAYFGLSVLRDRD
jgi:glycosyltransferase involved in cell wall biosynthesis